MKNVNSLVKAIKNVSSVLVLVVGLTACGPSEKQLADQTQIECLDKLCYGDVLPKTSPANSVVKIGGRYFSVPKEYGNGLIGLVFYCPSKTPLTGPAHEKDSLEKGLKPFHTRIEMFPKSTPAPIELSDLVATAVEQGRPTTPVSRSKDLEVITVQLRPEPTNQTSIFIARNATFPSGKPAVAGCGRREPDDVCSAYFAWDKNLSVTVRFNQRHAEDWPQIYAEIARVMSLVKPL